MEHLNTLNQQMVMRYGIEKCASIMQLADNPQELQKQATMGRIMRGLGRLRGIKPKFSLGRVGKDLLKGTALLEGADWTFNEGEITRGATHKLGNLLEMIKQWGTRTRRQAQAGKDAFNKVIGEELLGKANAAKREAADAVTASDAAEIAGRNQQHNLEKLIRMGIPADKARDLLGMNSAPTAASNAAPAASAPTATPSSSNPLTAEEALGPLELPSIPEVPYSEQFARDPLGSGNSNSLLWQ